MRYADDSRSDNDKMPFSVIQESSLHGGVVIGDTIAEQSPFIWSSVYFLLLRRQPGSQRVLCVCIRLARFAVFRWADGESALQNLPLHQSLVLVSWSEFLICTTGKLKSRLMFGRTRLSLCVLLCLERFSSGCMRCWYVAGFTLHLTLLWPLSVRYALCG